MSSAPQDSRSPPVTPDVSDFNRTSDFNTPSDFDPTTGLFNYYVDSVNGNDGNSGLTPALAFASFTPLASLPARSGLRIGMARGSLWRAQLTVPQAGMTFAPYGSGAAPQISNSVQFSSGSWTNVAGNEYQISAGGTTGPNPGGPVPCIFWIDNSGIVTALRQGTSGSLTANQWAIATNQLHVNIGRAPVATDKFEVGQVYGILIDKSNVVINGLYVAFCGNYNIAININAAVSGVQIIGCEIAYTSADGCNVNLGTGTNISFLSNNVHNTFTDGSGGGDGFSAHGACSGVAAFNTFNSCEKNGVAHSEKGTWDVHKNVFTAANFVAYLDGGGAGVFRVWGNTSVNEKPNLTAGEPRFYFAGTMPSGTICHNNSIAKGSGSGNERGIRLDNGVMTADNNAVWGAGTTPFSIGLYQAGGTVTETNNGCGGCTTNRLNWGSTAPITISSDPYTNTAGGNLKPGTGSPLLAAGIAVTGFTTGTPPDAGYTGAT